MRHKFVTEPLIVTVLLLILATVCSCSSENNEIPDVNLSYDMMNKVIQIKDLPEFGNTHKNNSILSLQVINLSTENIIFDHQSCFSVFIRNGENWVTVENSMHYPSEIRTLPPKNLFPGGIVLGISPYIPNMVDDQVIRIILLGHFENDEDKLVGAYLDITLRP